MPHLVNPPQEFASTANNKPVAGEGPYLGRDWVEYRQARIVKLLSDRDDWDPVDTQKMQLDQTPIPWQEIREIVLSAPVQDDDARLAVEILHVWDGVSRADSTGAAVYEFFLLELNQRMVKAKAPNGTSWALGKGFNPLVLRTFFRMRSTSNLVQCLKERPEGWFDAGWPSEVADALGAAVRNLRETSGSNPSDWSWGAVHNLVLSHPLGVRPPLAKIYNRGPYPTGGDQNTIAQAGRLPDEFGSNVTNLANLRVVYDVGNWDESRCVLCGGQSGNPFSIHYDDLLNYWLRGEMVTMAWSRESIQKSTKQTLHLLPE